MTFKDVVLGRYEKKTKDIKMGGINVSEDLRGGTREQATWAKKSKWMSFQNYRETKV
jgi:hypothetical protein